MRELHHTLEMHKTQDYAAYTLFATGAPALNLANPLRLTDYLDSLASRRVVPPIGVSIKQHFGSPDRFRMAFQRQNQQPSPSFERDLPKLITSGKTKDWSLVVVEVDPAEIRLRYVNNSQWRRHQRVIEEYRSSHEDHAAKTNAELVADLPPYCETLVFRAPNPVLAVRATIFEFAVPRDDRTSPDRYEVHFLANDILIVESFGLAQRQLRIDNSADSAAYTAAVTEIQ